MDAAPLVETRDGPVVGTRNDGIEVYRGIPYARAHRFRAPVPPSPWSDPLDATDFGPIAPQAPGAQFQRADLIQDEDCLSANVWTPGSDDERRPVMVWIHGGAFRTGSGASPLYEGTALAARGDVVVITINYRLGALGFLAHPSLAAEGEPNGNWGLLDQIEALRWVRDNAAAFGGDPDDVTIFGESAGAAAVALLLVMPKAHGLFHKAIVQSGAPLTSKAAGAHGLAELLAGEAGTDVAGLRDLPVADVLAAQQAVEAKHPGRTFIPNVDHVAIPELPRRALAAGRGAAVPTIIGTNADEWRLWAPADKHSRDLDEDGLRTRLDRLVPSDAVEGLIDAYRTARTERGEDAKPNDLFYAIESDRAFRVHSLRLADEQIAHAPTFTYLFEWASPAMGGWLGACHGLEIAFCFGNQGRGELAAFTGSGPDADALGATMMDAWIAFANTGDPSTPELGWPLHDATTRPTMVLDAKSGVVLAPREPERVALDPLVPG